MVFRVRAVLVMRVGLVMIIKREDFILLIVSRKDIGGVTIRALRQLFEKAEAFRNGAICSRIEGQIQPLGEFKHRLPSLTRLNESVNNAGHHQSDHDHSDHRSDGKAGGLDIHAIVLNQTCAPGHYNLPDFLHRRFFLCQLIFRLQLIVVKHWQIMAVFAGQISGIQRVIPA